MFRGRLSLYVRLFFLLAFVLTALVPMAALADGSGSTEPPIQGPDPDPDPPGDGLTDIGVVIIEASMLLT